jgi:hypothetical protein
MRRLDNRLWLVFGLKNVILSHVLPYILGAFMGQVFERADACGLSLEAET